MLRTVITGTGSYIPTERKTNSEFINQKFYGEDGVVIKMETDIIIDKFLKITGIAERRYVTPDLNTSDIAALASRLAIVNSKIDQENLDMIIVAHNFGDVKNNKIDLDTVPSLASRVKHLLAIKNPNCIAYDVLFGCPGWVLGLIQADAFFKAGMAKTALVIGAETLSRIIDVYDRDSMIFSDGAGAVVVEYKDEGDRGILAGSVLSHCEEETGYLCMDKSFNPSEDPNQTYMKMKGRKVYEYALKYVPEAMKACLDKSGVAISDLKKIFIHQANEKMDEAIVQAMYKLYGFNTAPKDVMPMCIQYLGNSSVATIPTLYDLVLQGKVQNQELNTGDIVLFASVGAGMNINAVCYRV